MNPAEITASILTLAELVARTIRSAIANRKGQKP